MTPSAFAARAAGEGLGVQIGPFKVRITVTTREILPYLWKLYAAYPVLERTERVYSIHARLEGVLRPRRPFRYVRFSVDGVAVHEDLPRPQALPVLEWGINLVAALRYHCYLLLHSAVLERNGCALLLPAAPGHGKSTLCAALAYRGWRLLSDEFGILRPGTTDVVPTPRPIPLKNDSINVIRAFAPQAVWGPTVYGTRKGTVAHVAPPDGSVERFMETARCRWIVFPRWERGSLLHFSPLSSSDAFMRLATNAFNYEVHGEQGFRTVQAVVDSSLCHELIYSDLDRALQALDRMVLDDVAAA